MGQLYKIFIGSQTYRLIIRFWEGMKIYLRYSFLGRISHKDKEREDNFFILDNSRFVRCLFNTLQALKLKIANYKKTSDVVKIGSELKQEAHSFPLRTIGIILLAAILTNISLSIVFNKEIGLFHWIIKIILLSIGIGSLGNTADWKTIKERSLFLRFMNNS